MGGGVVADEDGGQVGAGLAGLDAGADAIGYVRAHLGRDCLAIDDASSHRRV